MMPKLAIDFRSEENRVRLYYAAAVSLFGALVSRLVASSLLSWNDGGIGFYWCGAIALVPLVLYGWRALPAAAVLSMAVGALAVGAVAIGAVAIGRLAIGRLTVKRMRIGALEVDDLTVRRLRVREEKSPRR